MYTGRSSQPRPRSNLLSQKHHGAELNFITTHLSGYGGIHSQVSHKITGLFPPGAALGVFSSSPLPPPPPPCKTRFRHRRKLKLTGLIAYVMFYKICKFESSTISNDVITKDNGKIRASTKPNKLYIIRKILMRAIRKCTFY